MQKKPKKKINSQSIILNNHACYEELGYVAVKNVSGHENQWLTPRIPLLKKCAITLQGFPSAGRIEVEALLDTGTDITIVKPEKIEELDALLPIDIPVSRLITIGGVLQPAFDLAFFFPGSDIPYSSKFGVIAPLGWEFDVADIWLGQDFLNQLTVTLDGPRGRVTIRTSQHGGERGVVRKKVAPRKKQKTEAFHTQRGKSG